MTVASDPSLRGAAEDCLSSTMMRLAPEGVRLGCRLIRPDDASLLLPEEQRAIATQAAAARRASGAARHLARGLLTECGYTGAAVGREPSGEPIWPAGLVGSLAHDDEFAVAAIAPCTAFVSLGIDVEPAEPLPPDLSSLVTSRHDVPGQADPRLAARLFFAAKEAVYKAVHPLDRVILNHDDIVVDLDASRARTRAGRMLNLHWCVSPRIVVLATIAD